MKIFNKIMATLFNVVFMGGFGFFITCLIRMADPDSLWVNSVATGFFVTVLLLVFGSIFEIWVGDDA